MPGCGRKSVLTLLSKVMREKMRGPMNAPKKRHNPLKFRDAGGSKKKDSWLDFQFLKSGAVPYAYRDTDEGV